MTSGANTAGSVRATGQRFVALLARLAPTDGVNPAPWPGLSFYRATRPTAADPTVYPPSICVVAQGAKEVALGEQRLRYDPFHYAVIGAHLPMRAGVRDASEGRPFLAMSLAIDTVPVHELLLELEDAAAIGIATWEGRPPLRVCAMNGRLLDALVRFVGAVVDPLDRRILAPAALREVVYLALRSDGGPMIRLAARREGRTEGIARVLHVIERHLEERLDVPRLAKEAGMSVSSFYVGFKEATTLSPIQYVKRLRLHRARRMMVEQGCLAAEAAFTVGYESPSQFSREFKELFGLPPRRYLGNREAAAGA